MADDMMERPPRQAAIAFSSNSSSAGHRFDALRRKDEILAMVAHELRGPLTPMQLAIHLIRRASADRPEVLRSLDMLDRQITQIIRLAEDLMDATRIDRGALRVSKVPFDVVEVLAAPSPQPHWQQPNAARLSPCRLPTGHYALKAIQPVSHRPSTTSCITQ
ncbi:sensor histidine kinase [Paraburkholderia aromaticivorans]|uniref:sensor histidine kinase n=1 Tax=Paraburkholderia aromaticivorans TaxID=2026199 RepID=UPI001F0D3E8B|nr:histidine kinase dimerization/phospho-acceptor domain-containing protein [Paraburkholderia aromaticivorans]